MTRYPRLHVYSSRDSHGDAVMLGERDETGRAPARHMEAK